MGVYSCPGSRHPAPPTGAHPEPPTPAGQASTPTPGRQCEVARPDHRARGTAGLLVQGPRAHRAQGQQPCGRERGRTHSRMPTGIELEAHKGQQGRGSNPNLNPAAAAAGKHRKPRSHPPAKARQARTQGTATQSQEAKGTTRHTRLSTLSKGCDSNSVSNQPAIKQPSDR